MGNLPGTVKRLLFCPPCRWLGRVVVGASFVCLSATLGYRFVREPQLVEGQIATSDIRVPATAQAIVNREATSRERERIRQEVPPVYRTDPAVETSSRQHLERLLQIGDRLRAMAGGMPYLRTDVLSYGVQVYLRAADDGVWQEIRQRVAQPQPSDLLLRLPSFDLLSPADRSSRAVAELLRRKNSGSAPTYAELLRAVEQARRNYRLTQAEAQAGPEFYRDRLLDLRDTDWELTKLAARRSLDDLLAGGLPPGLPALNRQYRLVTSRFLPVSPDRRAIVVGLLDTTVVPNLQVDYQATEQAIAAALATFEPIVYRPGEIVVKAGQAIGKKEFNTLDSLGMTKRTVNVVGLLLVGVGVGAGMVVFGMATVGRSPWVGVRLKPRDLAAIGIVCCSAALAAAILNGQQAIAFLPLSAVGTILGSFYGSRLATLATGLLGIGIGLGLGLMPLAYAPIVVAAAIAAALTNRPHTRSHLAATGILVAAIQAGIYLAGMLLFGNVPPMLLASNALLYAAGGLISAIVALGAIPYVEHLSYALTPIRLAELANLDRPLLRRLVTEAPGTFQHTLFVANLAEAAARELGADTALVRTGTLYHDIGKTLQPEFFIENQMGQPNPHDRLNDPWRSAQIVKAHVSDGLKLAQKYRLPEQLQAFIPEHQGTIVISYFYHQAKTRLPEVPESEFRYAGPTPQSRETGIVMLADACEAALRSLGSDTTETEARELLLRIFQARWEDGQLQDAGLTLEDLDRIARVFFKVWKERNHGRIKYPPLADKLDPTGSSLPGGARDDAKNLGIERVEV